MVERTTLVGEAAMDDWLAQAPAVIEITTSDGRRLVERVDWPKGSRENPRTQPEIEAKFFDLATTRIPRERAA